MPELTDDARIDAREDDEPAVSSPPRRARFDAVTRYLLFASAAAIVIVLALTAAIVYVGARSSDVPRTAVERDFIVSREAAKQKPRDAKAWSLYASSAITAKKYDDAASAIMALDKLTKRAIVLLLRGDLASARGDLSAARTHYEKAAVQAKKDYDADFADKGITPSALGPSRTEIQAFVALGLLEIRLKDYESAVSHLQAAVGLDPTAADALTSLGDAQAAAAKPKDAEASYRKALQFIPDYKPALDGMKRLKGGR